MTEDTDDEQDNGLPESEDDEAASDSGGLFPSWKYGFLQWLTGIGDRAV